MESVHSIPDDVSAAADKFAEGNGLTRIALITAALREYIQRHVKASLTQRINQSIDASGQPAEDALIERGKATLRGQSW